MIGIITVEARQQIHLIADLKRMQLRPQRGSDRDGFVGGCFFGTRAEVQPPHHLPAGRPRKRAQARKRLLVENGHFPLGMRRGNAIGQVNGVVRHIAPNANQAMRTERAIKLHHPGIARAEKARLGNHGTLVPKPEKIGRNLGQRRFGIDLHFDRFRRLSVNAACADPGQQKIHEDHSHHLFQTQHKVITFS